MPNRRIIEVEQPEHRLGRHVNHDPRSRAFPYLSTGRTLRSVRHTRHVPVFNQGNLGSCTGNSMVGALACDPLHASLPAGITLDQELAVHIYSVATSLDRFPGTYPPDDTGSDGLSVAKAAKQAGYISGYRHAFSVDDALDALQDGPVITGFDWFAGFDNPADDGLVEISGVIRGGHEVVVDQYDASTGRIGITNSWGSGWGVQGRFFMTAATWEKLLDRDGDATIFVPADKPAPQPLPTPSVAGATFLDADPVLAARVARAAARRGLTVEEWLTHTLRRYFKL